MASASAADARVLGLPWTGQSGGCGGSGLLFRRRRLWVGALLLACLLVVRSASFPVVASPAGLAWGPVEAGPLKLYMTNPHLGFAGPKFPNVPHVNFHVDRKTLRGWAPSANFHIVRYALPGEVCFYVWESQRDRVVIDQCFPNFSSGARAVVEATYDFVQALAVRIDWPQLALVALLGLVLYVVVKAAIIGPVFAVFRFAI